MQFTKSAPPFPIAIGQPHMHAALGVKPSLPPSVGEEIRARPD